MFKNLLVSYSIKKRTPNFNRTYIIGHYNPSVGIIDLVSHTSYVVCVNFIYKWRERQIFKKLFMTALIALRVFARNLLRGIRRKNTFFVFCFDIWPWARTLALRLISQHTTH